MTDTTSAAATPTITAGSVAARRHSDLNGNLRHQERGDRQDADAGSGTVKDGQQRHVTANYSITLVTSTTGVINKPGALR